MFSCHPTKETKIGLFFLENKHLPSDSLSALITILVTFCILSIWLYRSLLRSLALQTLLLLQWILVLWPMMSLWLLHEFVRLIPVVRTSPPTDASSPESSDATIMIGDKSPLHDFTEAWLCEWCFECDWWWLFDWNMCWRPSRKWSVRLDGLAPRFDDAPWHLSSYRAGNDSFCSEQKLFIVRVSIGFPFVCVNDICVKRSMMGSYSQCWPWKREQLLLFCNDLLKYVSWCNCVSFLCAKKPGWPVVYRDEYPNPGPDYLPSDKRKYYSIARRNSLRF